MHTPDLDISEKQLFALAGQLRQGNSDAEEAFVTLFKQVAESLLSLNPQRLHTFVKQLADVPLNARGAQHLLAFYQALALRKTEQYKAAIAVFDKLLGQPSLEQELAARTLNSRAVAYELSGRPEKAFRGYQKSLRLWEKVGNGRYQGMVHLNMGILAYKLRQYENAEFHLRQAQSFFNQLKLIFWEAAADNELGLVHRDLGEWEPAMACFEKAESQYRQENSADNLAISLQNKGELLLFSGQINKAEMVLLEALEYMVSNTYRVDIYLYLGLIRQANGDPVAAAERYEQALKLAQAIERSEIYPHVYYHLGDLAYRQGDPAAARVAWSTAVAHIEAAHQPIQDEMIKISLLGRWQQIYEALLLLELGQGNAAEAYQWAERIRARSFVDALVGPGPTLPAAALQARLPEGTAVLCYFTTGVLAWDIPMLQAIPKDNPLRELILLPASIILFVIDAQHIQSLICPFDPNTFASASPRHLDATRFLDERILSRLYEGLLAPAKLAETTDRLILVPHGPLHQVPFAALNPYRGSIRSLTLAPSGTVLATAVAGRPKSASPASLSIGYRGEHIPLEYAEAEAVHLAEMREGSVKLNIATGNSAHLRDEAPKYAYLHFACHAHFKYEEPLSSYLEIGRQNYLTARDILESWQISAELVTLSACETGVSHILRGDEPMGLVRAFLSAGARRVLVSQWPVDDLATFLFMHRFYGLLGEQPAAFIGDVLTLTQHWLKNVSGTMIESIVHTHLPAAALPWPVVDLPDIRPFAEPNFWAGFVLIGGDSVIGNS